MLDSIFFVQFFYESYCKTSVFTIRLLLEVQPRSRVRSKLLLPIAYNALDGTEARLCKRQVHRNT